MPGTVLYGFITYAFMVAAFFLASRRWFHIPVMIGCMLFDLGMPFYLYTHRDWYKRLIEHQDLFSFLVWCHFGLVLSVYVLYFVQIQTARRLLAGDAVSRAEHRGQGKAMLAVRALALITGALLYSPS